MKRLSSSAYRLFELVRGQDEPDELARNRVAHALSVKIASGAGAMATGASVAKSATLGAIAAKSTLVVGITGTLVAAGWLATRPPRPAAPPPIAARPQAAVVAQATPVVEEESTSVAPAPAPEATRAAGRVSASRKLVRSVSQPEASTVVSRAEDELRPETEALRLAQQALRDRMPVQALKLLDAQDLRFRDGLLNQERAAMRVLALCQTGRVEEARAQAIRFEQRWPRSALLGRVRAACWAP